MKLLVEYKIDNTLKLQLKFQFLMNLKHNLISKSSKPLSLSEHCYIYHMVKYVSEHYHPVIIFCENARCVIILKLVRQGIDFKYMYVLNIKAVDRFLSHERTIDSCLKWNYSIFDAHSIRKVETNAMSFIVFYLNQ